MPFPNGSPLKIAMFWATVILSMSVVGIGALNLPALAAGENPFPSNLLDLAQLFFAGLLIGVPLCGLWGLFSLLALLLLVKLDDDLRTKVRFIEDRAATEPVRTTAYHVSELTITVALVAFAAGLTGLALAIIFFSFPP